MTNPSPRNANERAAHREKHDANTYFKQAILDTNNVGGRFAKEEASTVVGAGATYSKAAGPWADPTAAVLNSAPDPVGYDQTSAPDLGDPPPRRELATSDAPAQLLQSGLDYYAKQRMQR
jgi:hypothetical protein